MAHPLILLGMLAAGVVGTNGYLLRSSTQDPKLVPHLMGVDARYVMGGVGLAAVVLGGFVPVIGPILATVGAGAVIGAMTNADTTGVVAGGLDNVVKAWIASHGGAPQLPGPTSPPLDASGAPTPPAARGWMDWLLSPGTPAAAPG